MRGFASPHMPNFVLFVFFGVIFLRIRSHGMVHHHEFHHQLVGIFFIFSNHPTVANLRCVCVCVLFSVLLLVSKVVSTHLQNTPQATFNNRLFDGIPFIVGVAVARNFLGYLRIFHGNLRYPPPKLPPPPRNKALIRGNQWLIVP